MVIFTDSRSSCMPSLTPLSILNITRKLQFYFSFSLHESLPFTSDFYKSPVAQAYLPVTHQLAKEAALTSTSCPFFLAQDLMPHLANIIKSNWPLHYISYSSTAHYNSIQCSPFHSWFHNQYAPAFLISVICRLLL